MTMSLQEISDRIEIGDLLIRYTVAIDTKDWALLDRCFADGARVDYSASGGIVGPYPEARRWLEKALAPFTMTQHFISNTTVEFEGDRATSRTYLINPMGMPKPGGGLNIFTVGAYYNDQLVRTDQGWRIAERVEELAYMDGSLPQGLEVPS
jgi:hypothetical protein